jgi:hypothetical protein
MDKKPIIELDDGTRIRTYCDRLNDNRWTVVHERPDGKIKGETDWALLNTIYQQLDPSGIDEAINKRVESWFKIDEEIDQLLRSMGA